VVECNLAKVEVAGSNPVSRSQNRQLRGRHWRLFSFLSLTCIYLQPAFELFEIFGSPKSVQPMAIRARFEMSVEFHSELDVRVSRLL
jgi:hypothetical protein